MSIIIDNYIKELTETKTQIDAAINSFTDEMAIAKMFDTKHNIIVSLLNMNNQRDAKAFRR